LVLVLVVPDWLFLVLHLGSYSLYGVVLRPALCLFSMVCPNDPAVSQRRVHLFVVPASYPLAMVGVVAACAVLLMLHRPLGACFVMLMSPRGASLCLHHNLSSDMDEVLRL